MDRLYYPHAEKYEIYGPEQDSIKAINIFHLAPLKCNG